MTTTPLQLTGVQKKSELVTREARSKWSLAKLKGEYLIGNWLISLDFCWKFDLGKFSPWFTSKSFLIKQKIIHQNVKQIDLYQMVLCLRLYMLHSGRIWWKTFTHFIWTPNNKGLNKKSFGGNFYRLFNNEEWGVVVIKRWYCRVKKNLTNPIIIMNNNSSCRLRGFWKISFINKEFNLFSKENSPWSWQLKLHSLTNLRQKSMLARCFNNGRRLEGQTDLNANQSVFFLLQRSHTSMLHTLWASPFQLNHFPLFSPFFLYLFQNMTRSFLGITFPCQ